MLDAQGFSAIGNHKLGKFYIDEQLFFLMFFKCLQIASFVAMLALNPVGNSDRGLRFYSISFYLTWISMTVAFDAYLLSSYSNLDSNSYLITSSYSSCF